jgi:hypothetical protein
MGFLHRQDDVRHPGKGQNELLPLQTYGEIPYTMDA